MHDNIPNAKIPNMPTYPTPLYQIYFLLTFHSIIRGMALAAEAWPWPARHGQMIILLI